MNELLKTWRAELLELKGVLYQIGDSEPNQYNLYANEALRLSMCISELQQVIIDEF